MRLKHSVVVQVEIEQVHHGIFVVFLLCIHKIFLPQFTSLRSVTNENERAKLFSLVLYLLFVFILFGTYGYAFYLFY